MYLCMIVCVCVWLLHVHKAETLLRKKSQAACIVYNIAYVFPWMLKHLNECWSTYYTYTFTRMTHRCWSSFCVFPRHSKLFVRNGWNCNLSHFRKSVLLEVRKKKSLYTQLFRQLETTVLTEEIYLPERVPVEFASWIWNKWIYKNNAQIINV